MTNTIPNKIRLTPALEESLTNERGYSATTHFELRRLARFRCRGNAFARLQTSTKTQSCQLDSLAPLADFDRESFIIVRDLSRSGVGFVSHQQLFPEMKLELELEAASLLVRVARCRKLGPCCFEVGAVIVERLSRE